MAIVARVGCADGSAARWSVSAARRGRPADGSARQSLPVAAAVRSRAAALSTELLLLSFCVLSGDRTGWPARPWRVCRAADRGQPCPPPPRPTPVSIQRPRRPRPVLARAADDRRQLRPRGVYIGGGRVSSSLDRVVDCFNGGKCFRHKLLHFGSRLAQVVLLLRYSCVITQPLYPEY